jgi:hypothetical protein
MDSSEIQDSAAAGTAGEQLDAAIAAGTIQFGSEAAYQDALAAKLTPSDLVAVDATGAGGGYLVDDVAQAVRVRQLLLEGPDTESAPAAAPGAKAPAVRPDAGSEREPSAPDASELAEPGEPTCGARFDGGAVGFTCGRSPHAADLHHMAIVERDNVLVMWRDAAPSYQGFPLPKPAGAS